jgi:(p)ppGpp synthase/HD superfamily hydrolase
MMNAILDKAMFYARSAHEGQLDDSGQDFFDAHPAQVAMAIMIIAPHDHALQAAAYLHDVIEDTTITYEDLVKDFGTDIADLVNEVTQEGQKDEHGYYFPRLKTRRGIMLKFADRLSNLSRMDVWPEERQAHYLKRSKFWKHEKDTTRNSRSNTKLPQSESGGERVTD